MATPGTFMGHLMAIYMNGERIAATKGAQFSLGANMRDMNNCDLGDADVLAPGRRNISASGSAHFQFDAGYGAKDLIDALDQGSSLTVLISSESAGDPTYSFTGYIEKFDADFPDHENSTFSYSVRGTSDLDIITIPSILSAAVADANPDDIVIVFSENLDEDSVPATSAFSATGKTISGVDVSGDTVTVTVNSAYANGNTITVSYVPPVSDPLQSDATGRTVVAFTNQAVTNNVS